MTEQIAAVYAVDAGKRREAHLCGCAWLHEPPAAEGGPWRKRPVARCSLHVREPRQAEDELAPPEITR